MIKKGFVDLEWNIERGLRSDFNSYYWYGGGGTVLA